MNTRRKRSSYRTTRKNYISELKNIYPSCKHDNGCNADQYSGEKITYGEMDYDGINKLYNHIQKLNSKTNTFIDIGSGRGKLCLFMSSSRKIKRSIGIELVKERCEDALILKSKLPPEYSDKVTFVCSNIFDASIEKDLPTGATVFVWFSNLCFEQHTINDVFEKLINELPNGSIICCSKRPQTDNAALTFIKNVQIDMSWSKNSNVYIYSINK